MLYLEEGVKYSYNDVSIVPAILSNINSRSECNPFDENGNLPIFAAPMSTVVNETSFSTFKNNGIIPILPRNIDIQTRLEYLNSGNWIAVSLQEFDQYFTKIASINEIKVLIDVANGHMKRLYELVREAKSLSGDKIKIMIGNIANPYSYIKCVEAGVDYVRVGIGGGSGCTTSSNTGIHFPMASLITEMCEQRKVIKNAYTKLTKIVADGGIRGYSDVVKALALGADYVMIGSVFASLEDSAAPVVDGKKVFYGMASREGQIDIQGCKTKTAEGIKKELPITGTIAQWSENMAAYLRSALSYIGFTDLKNIKRAKVVIISPATQLSINK